MGAEGEIRDALTNLIFNAVDAMPDGGILTLRTSVRGRNEDAGTEPEIVCIEVQDTGVGMDAETRRRCLEPFFTTKGERGTGLGLAMVYGMIQRHSAGFELDSAPGEGSTFRLLFPVATAAASSLAILDTPCLAARLRILLIDDDPMLIKSLRDALEGDGHAITAATGGQAGIDAFRESMDASGASSFDVVITDLGMPHVDGRKVAASVHVMSPNTPIIMLTGWGHRLVAENDIPEHVTRVLNKPPRMQELRVTLAELTGQRGVPGAPGSDESVAVA
jgi:CheY-like chemotaxis protein